MWVFILFLGRAIICCEKHPFNGHGKTAFGSACQATCRKCRIKICDRTGYEISLQIAVPVQKQEGIILQGQKVKVEKSRQEVKIGKEVATALGFKFKVSSIKTLLQHRALDFLWFLLSKLEKTDHNASNLRVNLLLFSSSSRSRSRSRDRSGRKKKDNKKRSLSPFSGGVPPPPPVGGGGVHLDEHRSGH